MKTFGIVLVVVCVLVFASVVAGAEEYFSDFRGATEVVFGQVYTYSVLVSRNVDRVHWSATGGTVKKDWWDGSRYFGEVQWSENKADESARLKVYGQKKGSEEFVDLRLYVTEQQTKTRGLGGRSLQNGAGKCLDVAAEELYQNGGKVQIWDCNGAIQQQWAIDGLGRLVNGGGKCLDIHAPDLHTNGGKVQVWDCVDVDQQKWTLNEKGALVSKGGKCLDVYVQEIKTNGGKVQIWDCLDGAVQQQWKWLEPSTK